MNSDSEPPDVEIQSDEDLPSTPVQNVDYGVVLGKNKFWIFNRWAVLETLYYLIDWEKVRVNFQVFLECAHPAFLTTW